MKFIRSITIFSFCIIAFLGCAESNDEVRKEEHSASRHFEEVKLSQAAMNEIGLETETVTLKQFTAFLTLPAKVVVDQDKEAQVGSLIPGRVYKVHVKAGDYVRTGQELMLVEGLEIGEIIAGYLTTKANLDFYKANYERQKTLIEQNIGSQRSYLESQAEYQKALAEFDAEDKKIHSVGLNDEDVRSTRGNQTEEHTSGTLSVKSPIEGIVVERNVVIGQLVDGASNAFKIINTSTVWIDGQVYEKDINRIGKNKTVFFTAASYPEEKFTGKVNFIGQTVDEKSRTITIRTEFTNVIGSLKPQMYGELHLPSDVNSKAILIPAESIVKINNEDFVFVQKEEGVFEKRSVKAGIYQDGFIQIQDGLRENEKIVVKGAFSLKSELLKEELEDEH